MDVLVEFLMAPPEEKHRQIRQCEKMLLDLPKILKGGLLVLKAWMPEREITARSYIDTPSPEEIRMAILSDPLNKKNRRYSLSG